MHAVTTEQLQTMADDIVANGPCRVMIRDDRAVTVRRAREEYGITPTVVFIRYDGWSLGAPENLEDAARKQWEDLWVGVLRKPSTTPEVYTNETDRR